MKKIVAEAPASTSNLGAGFDVLGLALDVFSDLIEVSFGPEKLTIEVEGVSKEKISVEPEFNSAGLTAIEVIKRYKVERGIKVKIVKGVPAGTGLGSSGASAAGAAVALNVLMGLKLENMELVRIAAEGERASAGTVHADNVAPSIYGGFTIAYSYDPIQIKTFPPPERIIFALAVPSIQKTTEASRAVLPKTVAFNDLTYNVGGTSLAVAALLRNDSKLLGEALLRDRVVEPKRAHLFPGYIEAKKAALDAGAYGATLSGAGPSIIAVVENDEVGEVVTRAMAESFQEIGIECKRYVTRPTHGAKILPPNKPV